jgi:Mechanosensitive ion channel, conserved TM helix
VDQFRSGLGTAWAHVATFIPKLIGFLVILVIGYFVAKLLAKAVDGILERVGFDRVVERGGVRNALARSKYDASGLLGMIVFWAVFLFVLQLAFGVFGPNPISRLISGVIAYLPKVFVAILIVIIGAAIAAAAKEIVEATLGGLSYGGTLARVVAGVIIAVAIFAALSQLQIAPWIVNGLFYAVLAIIVLSASISIGVGGIDTMRQYWQRAALKADMESTRIKRESQGASERTQGPAAIRQEQAEAPRQAPPS